MLVNNDHRNSGQQLLRNDSHLIRISTSTSILSVFKFRGHPCTPSHSLLCGELATLSRGLQIGVNILFVLFFSDVPTPFCLTQTHPAFLWGTDLIDISYYFPFTYSLKMGIMTLKLRSTQPISYCNSIFT